MTRQIKVQWLGSSWGDKSFQAGLELVELERAQNFQA